MSDSQTAINKITSVLEKSQDAIQGMLTKAIPADRFIKVIIQEMRKNPYLMTCDQTSILNAVFIATKAGLQIGEPYGHCYLVPYGKECTFVLGAKGAAHLAITRGVVKDLHRGTIMKQEKYEYRVIDGVPRLDYTPNLAIDHSSKVDIQAVFMTAVVEAGITHTHLMGKPEIERIKNASAAGDRGPWGKWYDRMAEKTVVKQGLKFLPLPDTVELAFSADTQGEIGETLSGVVDVDFSDVGDRVDAENPMSDENREPEQTKTEQVKEKVGTKKKTKTTAE